jgi:hypothetical protein
LEENVKKTRIGLGLFVVLVLLVLLSVGCAGGKKGIEGTWVTSSSGLTETLVITASTVSVSDTGTITASLTLSITNNDTGASHLLMTQTSATGIYTILPNGTQWYATYHVNGDTLLFSASNSGYPSTASTSYTRQ